MINLDQQRQDQAKRYARIQRRWSIMNMAAGGLYAAAWLVFGWNILLRNSLIGITQSHFMQVAGFALVFGVIFMVVDIPMSYYTDYVLPRRFDLSTQALREWIIDQLKAAAISLPIGLMLLEAIYALLRAAPLNWWLWGSLIMLFFTVVMSILAPVVLMPVFNKFVPLADEHALLVERLMALAKKAGTKVEGVYKFDMSRRTKAANAALTGLGKTRRIILGDTLLDNFSSDEIESVLAHEMGHQVHMDIPISILLNTISTLVMFFLASTALTWGVEKLGLYGISDVAAMPLLTLVMGAFGLVSMPLANGFSRWREKRADSFALEVTGNGSAYANAMTRLANQNLADADPEGWVEFMFYSHPALEKRIAMAKRFEMEIKQKG